MERLELAPADDDLTVEVSIDKLSRVIGEQGIIDGPKDESDFFYLAGIALDGQRGSSSVEDILMEYIRNCQKFEDLTDEEYDQIEEILRCE